MLKEQCQAENVQVHVGTECTLVHCSLYTGCIYRVLTPRELKNQVVNLQNIATVHFVPR